MRVPPISSFAPLTHVPLFLLSSLSTSALPIFFDPFPSKAWKLARTIFSQDSERFKHMADLLFNGCAPIHLSSAIDLCRLIRPLLYSCEMR